jgi:hypothetical protein
MHSCGSSSAVRRAAEPLVSPVYTFGGRKEEEVRSTYRQIYGLIPTGDENAAPVIGSFL